MAMKKIQGEVGNYRNYAREDAKPETPAPSQAQTMGKKLRQEEVIADIKALYEQQKRPDQSSKHLQKKDDSNLMDTDNKYFLSHASFF